MTTGRSVDAVVFLNHDTIADLHWPDIWQSFAPVTPLGRRAKTTLRPYRTGEEAAVTRAFDQLRSDAVALDPASTGAIVDALQPLPDIVDAMTALAQPETVLSFKQLLALKQFIFYGTRLAADANLNWTSPEGWSRMLEQFGDVSVPSFAIDHVADDNWRAAATAVAQATHAVHTARQQRDKVWQEELGVRPTPGGQLLLRLPEQRALAEQLMTDNRVRWLRNTPFEAVFEVQPTSDWSAAEVRLTAAKGALEAAQDQVLHRFCDALRGLLPALQRLAEDIAGLDLRVAKVRLLRQWNGAVPTISDRVRLEGGVHPIVAERLRSSRHTAARHTVSGFVPLDFNPDPGPNVLCGANMGGKTVAMSLLCVSQALTQYGLPVPARAFETRLFRFIRFCGRAGTDLDNGLSAYGREITNLEHTWALWQDVGDGFVCLDEPARSTNPVEGEALVVAMLRLIRTQPRDSVWIVATHLAGAVAEPGVAKFRVRGLAGRLAPGGERAPDVQQPSDPLLPGGVSPPGDPSQTEAQRLSWLAMAMDYRVIRMTDDTPPAEALQVAKWLGLSDEILKESQRYLREGKP